MNTIVLKKYNKITQEEKENVINLFIGTKENSVPSISKTTGITESAVSRIIDNYLKTRKI